MKTYTVIIEKCKDTGLYVGYIPGIKGAHSQGETVDELIENLKEVLEFLKKDGPLEPDNGFSFEIKIPTEETLKALDELERKDGETFNSVDEVFELSEV